MDALCQTAITTFVVEMHVALLFWSARVVSSAAAEVASLSAAKSATKISVKSAKTSAALVVDATRPFVKGVSKLHVVLIVMQQCAKAAPGERKNPALACNEHDAVIVSVEP